MPSIRIGLISDTHGLLRPEALQALQGAAHIIHAGDIGNPDILERLKEIAPVTAVRGNNDGAPWAAGIPDSQVLEAGKLRILVLHDLKEWKDDPTKAGYDVVVTGHSHKPAVSTRDGVLYVNPGSAGPRRFKLPISIAILDITDGVPDARIEILEI